LVHDSYHMRKFNCNKIENILLKLYIKLSMSFKIRLFKQDKKEFELVLQRIKQNKRGCHTEDNSLLDKLCYNYKMSHTFYNCMLIAKGYLQYNNSEALPRNINNHFKWLKKAKKLMYQMNKRDEELFLLFAKYHYFHDKDYSKNLEGTRKYCLKIPNHPEALYLLGCVSLIDQMKYSIKERNYQNSLSYFQSSAKMGNKDAEYQVKMVSSMID
jgi:hypothetical protein